MRSKWFYQKENIVSSSLEIFKWPNTSARIQQFWVHSAFDRIANQEIFLEVKNSRRVDLTTLRSLVCRMSK